jgi:hypothetical protein
VFSFPWVTKISFEILKEGEMISSLIRTTKKHNAFLISLTALFIASLACSLGTGSSAVLPASSQEPSSQPSANSTIVVPTRNSQVLGDLGSISYTLDTARQVSGTFDFISGENLILTVADANGYGWMLSIPADALLSNQTITMTPFASMDVSQSGAKIISGVQLEPDGLQFVDAVRLSVTAPIDNPGISLIFSMNRDGSQVAFAPTANTSGGKTAIAEIWHFSAAGTDNSSHSGDDAMNVYRKWAAEDYKLALDAAKQFIRNSAPTPPTPPSISQFCRGTEVNPEQGEVYEYIQNFLSPYQDTLVVLLGSMQTLALLEPFADFSDGFELARAIMQIAENSILQVGKQVQEENPPDRLPAVISTALRVGREIALLNGTSEINPKVILWAEYLRDYYLGELKTKHDYRAFPILLSLNEQAQLIGGEDRLADIMSAMTFEVILDTSFDATWYSGEKLFATGNVVQNADVKDIKNELDPPNFLWGTANNFIIKSKSGTFKDSTGSYPLAGQSDTGTLWLLNWDACVTKTFDALLTGFYGDAQSKPGKVAGASSMVSFNQYWWKDAGAFMFTVPMQNLSPTLGEGSFSGSGSAADGNFTGSGQIHIAIKHTPK